MIALKAAADSQIHESTSTTNTRQSVNVSFQLSTLKETYFPLRGEIRLAKILTNCWVLLVFLDDRIGTGCASLELGSTAPSLLFLRL